MPQLLLCSHKTRPQGKLLGYYLAVAWGPWLWGNWATSPQILPAEQGRIVPHSALKERHADLLSDCSNDTSTNSKG